MSTNEPQGSKGQASGVPPKRRIDTQIHRRKKVKASLPLEAEWEESSKTKSTNLRMPSEKMKK